MNEPEPSAVANGSPPQASPFPFGPAADPTPTDDAGNPLRRMRRDTLFCRSSYDSCRRRATGHSPKRELHASTPVQPVRPNAKRRKSPPKRGFTMEMRGSFCCPIRFAFARQPRKTQESDTNHRIRTGYKKPRISFVGRRGGRFGRRNVLRPVGTLRRRSLRILFEQIGRRQRLAHQKGFGELRAHTFEQHDRLL